ncbi:MAG: thiolase family protein, partial [bacterium]|nr:thiolase family protein [bacterium]
AEQDEYTYNSFKKTFEAWERGFYKSHVIPFKNELTYLEKDEYVYLRKSLIEKPDMIKKAPLLFDRSDFSIKDFYNKFQRFLPAKQYIEGKTKATITFFNSVARSDGAAAIIVTSEKHAKELNLEIIAEIVSWGFYGTNPVYMGISPAFAVEQALKNTGLKFTDIDAIEIHEAFAATVLATFKVGDEKFGHKWFEAYKSGIINPNGGSLAIGHPLATTGVRVILNLMYRMKEDKSIKYGLACACAAGGLGGAIILKRY